MKDRDRKVERPIRSFFFERLLILFISVLYPFVTFTQIYSSSRSNNILKNWAFEGQAGIYSYFGDLSIYDGDIVNKILKESGPAIGLSATKYFGKYFSVSGELISGQLKAEKNNISFESNIIEYNGQVQFDLIRIFRFESQSNFSVILLGGIGNVFFSSNRYSNSQSESYITQVPEFIYFFGGRLEYHPTKTLKLGLGGSIKQLQNDKLDVTVENSNYDYYSYINLGVAYKLNHKSQKRGGKKLNLIKKRKKRR